MEALEKSPLIRFGPASASGLAPRTQAQELARLAAELEIRVPGSAGHSRRVGAHAAGTAKRMGLAIDQVVRIRRAAELHDIGKVETPAEIVNRPGPLSAAEHAVVRRHADLGGWIVAGLGDPEMAAIVRHHHERFDGAGYPDGLSGEEIPLGARIVAVADTFDALASDRPYRAATRDREALDLLEAESGAQLDPDAVEAFRLHYSRFASLRRVAFRL
jgi:HD-GYP domain-containing protein (c-di-GMP phosphodiesterase class II)